MAGNNPTFQPNAFEARQARTLNHEMPDQCIWVLLSDEFHEFLSRLFPQVILPDRKGPYLFDIVCSLMMTHTIRNITIRCVTQHGAISEVPPALRPGMNPQIPPGVFNRGTNYPQGHPLGIQQWPPQHFPHLGIPWAPHAFGPNLGHWAPWQAPSFHPGQLPLRPHHQGEQFWPMGYNPRPWPPGHGPVPMQPNRQGFPLVPTHDPTTTNVPSSVGTLSNVPVPSNTNAPSPNNTTSSSNTDTPLSNTNAISSSTNTEPTVQPDAARTRQPRSPVPRAQQNGHSQKRPLELSPSPAPSGLTITLLTPPPQAARTPSPGLPRIEKVFSAQRATFPNGRSLKDILWPNPESPSGRGKSLVKEGSN